MTVPTPDDMGLLNETHDQALCSWVTSANKTDGDEVLDLRATISIDYNDMHGLSADALFYLRSELRKTLSRELCLGSPQCAIWERDLPSQTSVELDLLCDNVDYTDVYVTLHPADLLAQHVGKHRVRRKRHPLR